MARGVLSAVILLGTCADVTAENLLDNFEWLKQHGDEAMQAAQYCQSVLVELSNVPGQCRDVSKSLENFAAVVAWAALDHEMREGGPSFLATAARSPVALEMKKKAKEVILASTGPEIDLVCSNPECAIHSFEKYFEAFAGCYASSVCTVSGLGEGNFHRCRTSLQNFMLSELKMQAADWCQKDEVGVYCQQRWAELMVETGTVCYSLYMAPVESERGLDSRDYCSQHRECLQGWRKAEEHPTCSNMLVEMARTRGKNLAHLSHQLWGTRVLPSIPQGLSYKDACFSTEPNQADRFMV